MLFCAVAVAIMMSRTSMPSSSMALLIDDEKCEEVRRTYGLTKLGFLPPKPAVRLPEAYTAWEEIILQLPELNKTGRIREVIDEMPCLDLTLLKDDEASLSVACWALF